MNLSALSRTARQGLSEFAYKGCVILARRRASGHSIKVIPVWKIKYDGVNKLVALLESGWQIVRR